MSSPFFYYLQLGRFYSEFEEYTSMCKNADMIIEHYENKVSQ